MPISTLRGRLLIAFGLLALFLALPGPSRSPFSGIPFSIKGHAAVAALLLAALAAALFAPRRAGHARWLIALALCCAAKAGIAPLLREEGWAGRYWTAQPSQSRMSPVSFFRRGVRPWRVDRALAFDGPDFALFYVNDWPLGRYDPDPTPRDVRQPLLVRWTGWVDAAAPATLAPVLTANGAAAVSVDGRVVLRATDPAGAPVRVALSRGLHRIDVEYGKPAGQKPRFALTPLPLPVTPVPASGAELARARVAARAVDAVGIVALLLFLVFLAESYAPLRQWLLDDIWNAPDRIVLVAVAGVMLAAAVSAAVGARGVTVPLYRGDDPLGYEGMSRGLLFDGPLMRAYPGDTHPFFFYPLYSYALGIAHALFGEDYGTIRFFNWLCLAATAMLLWMLLRKWVTARVLVAGLLSYALFAASYLRPYTLTAFTDNLYLPLCVATVFACAAAFAREREAWLLPAGAATALGALTRPSLMMLLPLMLAALLWLWKGALLRRAAAAAIFGGGFAAAAAPFALRNWIVAGRLVLIDSVNLMLPYFLYPPGQKDIPIKYLRAHSRTAFEAIGTCLRIFGQEPARTAAVELRKLLFTLGLTRYGMAPCENCPRLLIALPVLFLLAMVARRIPRPLLIAMGAFALSHIAAMLAATPWTYGYKTILPLHLILLCGAAFLLPARRTALARRPAAILRAVPATRRSLSVVLPTYNEKDSIRQVILDFFATGVVDEVIVVNNNAAEGTSEQIAGTGAREVLEPRQGYGAATRRGMREAAGDLIVVCEPDGTFLARDIHKLLAYADDFDVVYGSRTSQPLVWRGANMGFFLRFGNWAVAKYMQLIFNTPTLSDVGCTMRLLKREVAAKLEREFRVDGSAFGAEMMVLTVRRGYRIAQIPVNYAERVGVSSVTGDPAKALLLGLQIIWLIARHRILDAFGGRDVQRAGADDLGAEQTATANS